MDICVRGEGIRVGKKIYEKNIESIFQSVFLDARIEIQAHEKLVYFLTF